MNATHDGFGDPGDQYRLALKFSPPPAVRRYYPLKRTLQDMILEFHETFSCKIDDRSLETLKFRMKLLDEETGELFEEIFEFLGGDDTALGEIRDLDDIDFQAVAKEMADMVYILFGTAISLGIDLDKAVRLVHASNMSKLGEDGKPTCREDGKVLKGPDYFEPDMTSCIKEL